MCKKEQCGENPSTIAELDPVKQKFICVRRGKQHYHEVRLFGGPGGLLGMLNLQQSNTHFRRKGHFSLWHCERTEAELLRLNVVFFFSIHNQLSLPRCIIHTVFVVTVFCRIWWNAEVTSCSAAILKHKRQTISAQRHDEREQTKRCCLTDDWRLGCVFSWR